MECTNSTTRKEKRKRISMGIICKKIKRRKMEYMNIEDITNSIKSKLGEEESGKIADDLANLLIHDKSLNDNIKNKDEEITKLKGDKDLLVQANANLLGKIPMGKAEDDEFGAKEEVEKPFDFK